MRYDRSISSPKRELTPGDSRVLPLFDELGLSDTEIAIPVVPPFHRS